MDAGSVEVEVIREKVLVPVGETLPEDEHSDGKRLEREQSRPLHGLLHPHLQNEEHHHHHHVHITNEVMTMEIPTPGVPLNAAILSDHVTQKHHSPDVGQTQDEAEENIPRTESYIQARRISEALKGPDGPDVDLIQNTSNIMFDEEFERKREKQQKKIQLGKAALKTLQQVFAHDSVKQDFFLESMLASQHMKELTSSYGSKQKNVKQFFLESVDTDTRQAVFGQAQLQEVREELKKAVEKNERKVLLAKTSASAVALEDDDSTSTIRSEECDDNIEEERALEGTWSKKNFWESLERLERLQEPPTGDLCATGKENPLYDIYGKSWKQRRIAPPPKVEVLTEKVVQQRLEPFPDKYLEPGVQEVIQSEAVRRLWDIVNSQLELFKSKDPLAFEMFGTLYDEVRAFAKLPEEDVLDFYNGSWAPQPLDEKKILELEPYEKLMTRFTVYQNALCFLAQHFEALTPIFAEIKQAYEDVFEKGEKETLEVEREQMEELELRKTLALHVRHTDKAGHRLLMEVKAEAYALQEHIQWQHHTLHTILGILWKMRSSLKMTSWAVSQLKILHKNKIEALAKEIVSTQGQILFDMALPGKYTEIMQRIRNQSDPKEIRRMLLAVRRQLRNAYRKIVIFEADYADTVPKAEFEVPQKKFSIISKKNQTLLDASNVLKTERQLRKQGIAALKSEIYETSGLVKDLKRKPTPRPSWTKISNEWPGGLSKFSEMKEGQSTREVINKVVEELSGKKVGELIHYIQPKGLGDKVPVYLQYDKPLLNRNYSAVEAFLFIRDVWRKRVDMLNLYRKIKQARKDEEDGVASYPDDLQYDLPIVEPFPEYIRDYFKKKCHLDQLRMEWIYNIVDSCDKHSSDARLVQFKGTLEGVINESIYHLFQMELDRIRDFLYAKADRSVEHKGYLEWPDLIKFIGELCPNKTEEEIAVINNLGGTSFGVRGTWAVVRAENLFEVDDEGKESNFVEVLYQQFEGERKEYIRDVYMELLTELGISEELLEHEDDPVWQTDVSMHTFYAGVMSVDQNLPDTTLIAYIAWVYLGVTALPGVTTLSTKLVEFLRARAHLTDTDLEKYNEDEDIEFENCIREIRDYQDDEATMDKLDLKKRRLTTKKLKFASLRQVMDRLFSGPLMRFGARVLKSKPLPEPEPEPIPEPEKEEPKRRHRHHHHRHHRRRDSKKENAQADDDFGFGFDDY